MRALSIRRETPPVTATAHAEPATDARASHHARTSRRERDGPTGKNRHGNRHAEPPRGPPRAYALRTPPGGMPGGTLRGRCLPTAVLRR